MADTCRYYYYEGGFFSSGNTCSVTGKREPVTEEYYRKYCCRDYNRVDCPLHKKYGPYISSGCFITTVVSNILGNPDNCQVLNDFRNFRNNILQKNSKYYDGLREYDVIGPTIAICMALDMNSRDMADMTYQLDLLKVHQLYLEGKYDEAYDTYCKMTRDLISYYGLDELYARLNNQEYDFIPEKAGHGKIRVLRSCN